MMPGTARFISLCVVFFGAAGRAADGPSAAMMAPVQDLVVFMSSLPAGGHAAGTHSAARHRGIFASHGVCIIENFPPFTFCGPKAVSRWEAGFRAHSAEDDLTELAANFDAAFDFRRAANRVYFSLPTTWIGRTHGRRFEEHGAWSFVLVHEAAGWRILGYGWGVTGYMEKTSLRMPCASGAHDDCASTHSLTVYCNRFASESGCIGRNGASYSSMVSKSPSFESQASQ
jgi:hypothetical protein